MFAQIYRHYLNSLAKIGPAEDVAVVPPDVDALLPNMEGSPSSISDVEVDEQASVLGDKFRGIGVLVGILGILIVFFAVAPTGLQVENENWLKIIGGIKVLLMCTLLVLVRLGSKSRLKDRWISIRREAERLRYEPMRKLTEELLQKDLPAHEAMKTSNDLREVMMKIAEGQVSYNQSKAIKYKAIERSSERISWAGFIFALLCALALLASEFHWIPHYAWLIFGTAFTPAFVGGVHGINSFLNIGGLAEEHSKMSAILRKMCAELTLINPEDTEEMSRLAERVYGQLVDRDTQWAEGARKVSLKPG